MKQIRFIRTRADLPATRAVFTYNATTSTGETLTFSVSKRLRQVLEALRAGPIYCASPVRLSQAVLELREIIGTDAIATDWFDTVADGEVARYGAYRLVWTVKGGAA